MEINRGRRTGGGITLRGKLMVRVRRRRIINNIINQSKYRGVNCNTNFVFAQGGNSSHCNNLPARQKSGDLDRMDDYFQRKKTIKNNSKLVVVSFNPWYNLLWLVL